MADRAVIVTAGSTSLKLTLSAKLQKKSFADAVLDGVNLAASRTLFPWNWETTGGVTCSLVVLDQALNDRNDGLNCPP